MTSVLVQVLTTTSSMQSVVVVVRVVGGGCLGIGTVYKIPARASMRDTATGEQVFLKIEECSVRLSRKRNPCRNVGNGVCHKSYTLRTVPNSWWAGVHWVMRIQYLKPFPKTSLLLLLLLFSKNSYTQSYKKPEKMYQFRLKLLNIPVLLPVKFCTRCNILVLHSS